jgi:hypothetical protein
MYVHDEGKKEKHNPYTPWRSIEAPLSFENKV